MPSDEVVEVVGENGGGENVRQPLYDRASTWLASFWKNYRRQIIMTLAFATLTILIQCVLRWYAKKINEFVESSLQSFANHLGVPSTTPAITATSGRSANGEMIKVDDPPLYFSMKEYRRSGDVVGLGKCDCDKKSENDSAELNGLLGFLQKLDEAVEKQHRALYRSEYEDRLDARNKQQLANIEKQREEKKRADYFREMEMTVHPLWLRSMFKSMPAEDRRDVLRYMRSLALGCVSRNGGEVVQPPEPPKMKTIRWVHSLTFEGRTLREWGPDRRPVLFFLRSLCQQQPQQPPM